MFNSIASHSFRCRIALVGVLLLIGAGGFARAPNSSLTDPRAERSAQQVPVEPIYIPIVTSDPFIG